MTPKEKAKELVYKCDETLEFSTPQRFARKCALIAVDEIISEIEPSVSMDVIEARIKYWEEVKQEIQKL
jgi:hypothetical protein